MMKLLFFDLETTGVRYWKNGVHQISGAAMIDGDIKEFFDYKVQPNPQAIIEDAALEVSGVTREIIAGYPKMEIVHTDITNMLSQYVNRYDKKDKFHLVGYNNSGFDDPFLRAFFVQSGDPYFGSWFWPDSIDVMVLASHFLMNVRAEMLNFKQSTVAKWLGIEVDEDKLHDASYDIELCIRIYQTITKQYEQKN